MVSERFEKSQFNWACVKLITDLALLHRCTREEMELAMTMVSNIAHSETPGVSDKELFYPAE